VVGRRRARWVESLQLAGRDAEIARDVVSEIHSRLEFLEEVGLGYLTLDRAAPTLSGGEAQRIRLAAQLGSNLQGVCYVLDEPTIGLHPRDNQILLDALHKLGDKGNTLVVVEHDEDTIRRADHIIDIGPAPASAAARWWRRAAQRAGVASRIGDRALPGAPLQHPLQPRRTVDARHAALTVLAASLHNLQQIDVERAADAARSAVTGVSGSGKSTLARDVLLANLQFINTRGWQAELAGLRRHRRAGSRSTACSRSTRRRSARRRAPARPPTSGFWDTIRKLFADTLEAKAPRLCAGRFSFNTGEGRCPACEGQGVRTIEMSFLPT
jgi:excinuclease ABC subunit A